MWINLVVLLWAAPHAVSGASFAEEARRLFIAEAWAPMIFQDEAPEYSDRLTGFNPVDQVLAFDFDGNQNYSDNAESVFRLSQRQTTKALEETAVYYSVIESETYFYINYVIYHAIDTQGLGHSHDTENIFTIVRKSDRPAGELICLITNAHGYGSIYCPDMATEQMWRSKFPAGLSRGLLKFIDQYSESHEEGYLETIPRFARQSQSPMLFVASRSHAIYKFSSKAWQEGNGAGTIYLPRDCDDCTIAARPLLGFSSAIRSYQLRSLDALIVDFRANGGPERFQNEQVGELPKALARPRGEIGSFANLFYSNKFKTRVSLADPIAFHAQFENQIQGTYIYNPYLKNSEAAPSGTPKLVAEAGIWGQWLNPLAK